MLCRLITYTANYILTAVLVSSERVDSLAVPQVDELTTQTALAVNALHHCNIPLATHKQLQFGRQPLR